MTAGMHTRWDSIGLLALAVVLFTFLPVSSARATFPGLGGQIVFQAEPTGQILPDIYSIEPDGTGLKRLTTADLANYQVNTEPSVAPQGGDIVFLRGQGEVGSNDVYRMESDGSNVRRLTNVGNADNPVFTNDGKRVLFISDEAIWSVNGDGSNARNLNATPFTVLGLAVDPGSDTVVYVTQFPGGHLFLRAVDDDGTNDRAFFSEADGNPPFIDNYDPDFAPSGPLLLTDTRQIDTHQIAVFKDPASGQLPGPAIPLTPAGPLTETEESVFDPSGTKVAFSGHTNTPANQIWVMDAAGGTPRQVTTDATLSAGNPSWEAVRTNCAGQDVTIGGTGRADVIRGTRRDDVIAAYDGDDKIVAKGGDDVVCAGADADVVLGGAGEDELHGRKGNDSLDGQADDDVLHGGAGNSDDCKEPHERGHGCD